VIGRARVSRVLSLVLVIAAAATPASGQVDEATLRDRLAELEAEVEAERAALTAARHEQQAELEALRGRRAELAREAVSLELQRQRLQRRLDTAAADAVDEQRRHAEATAAWDRVQASTRLLLDQARLHADQVPGRGATADALRELAERFDAVDPATPAAAYAALAATLDALDAEAQSVTLRPAELRTAAGRVEQVELLSVGHVAFAYRVGDRLGVAFASPADATGLRWREDLPGGLAARWRRVFDAAAGDPAAPLPVPMDVTGQVRADAAVDRATLADHFAAGGPVMWPLVGVAAVCLLLLLERGWTLYVRNGNDASLATRVVEAIRAGEHDRALGIARSCNNSAGRIIAALLARRPAGQHAMEDSVQEQLLYELPRLNRFLRGIGILAAVAPLLGLLGTVTGIISTFTVIRAVGNTAPSMMAGGISEALLTTATGLAIAIPVLLLNGVMRGRVDRIIAEAEEQAATVLNVVTHDRPAAAPPQEPDDA